MVRGHWFARRAVPASVAAIGRFHIKQKFAGVGAGILLFVLTDSHPARTPGALWRLRRGLVLGAILVRVATKFFKSLKFNITAGFLLLAADSGNLWLALLR